MHPADILALYDAEMRRDPPGQADQIVATPGLTFCASLPPAAHGGWVIYTQLDTGTFDAALSQMIEHLGQQEFEWKVYGHDTPADLRERLRAAGFRAEEPEALLALDLAAAPAWLGAPVTADVRRIHDPVALAAVEQVEQGVWATKEPWVAAMLAQEMVQGPEQISVYVAYADGVPASTAWIRFYPDRQFADLWGGATLPAHRGRGLYRALVATRAQEARARGVRFLTVDAGPMSRPILERLGFQFLTFTQPFIWEARA